MADQAQEELPRFGKYRAIREIGRGATSHVYLAESDGGEDVDNSDPFATSGLDGGNSVKAQRVAIKVVDFTDDRSKLSRRFRKLFQTEAAVTAQFDHPNIARVFDWRLEEKRAYLVMELVEGDGLENFVTMDKLLPMHRVVAIIFKVAMALDYAHRRGIVHRDIKPANVLVTKDDEVKLMDFGLALNIKKNVNVDSTFINGLGSPSYMSPEQIKGYTLNHQTDLYSLGVMFYQMLTGRLPFRGPNTAALVYKIINTEAVPVTQLHPDIPAETNKVISRALEKDLYSRYRLGADMAKDLSAIRFQILEDDAKLPDETKWKAVRGLPLLGKLDDVDIWELLRLSAWRVLPPATVIMRDGEPGKSFGFILEGEVELEKGDRALGKRARGDIIGEAGFLRSEGGKRSASVTTLNQVTYLEINPAAFAFATEELAHEIRRIAIDALVDQMQAANSLAKRVSAAAIHPTPIPEGETDVVIQGTALPAEAPGWSVFAKSPRASALAAAAAPAIVDPQPAAPANRAPAAPPEAPWIEVSPAATPAPGPTRLAATARGSTVVVQPLPAAAAAVIAQMAMTQQPRARQPMLAQPFELGPESTSELRPTPVSELPGDAVLTTEMGVRFDAPPLQSEMGDAPPRINTRAPSGASTVEMAPRFDSSPLATTEMGANFGTPPPPDSTVELAPDFDLFATHAPVRASPPTARAHRETVDLGANFDATRLPAATPAPPSGSWMPPPRQVVDQSTQELASHLLGGGAADFDSDRTMEMDGGFQSGLPLDADKFAADMFPPISLHGGAGARTLGAPPPRSGQPDGGAQGAQGPEGPEGAEGDYEATQVLGAHDHIPLPDFNLDFDDPALAAATPAQPTQALGAHGNDDEGDYEATQLIEGHDRLPLPAIDLDFDDDKTTDLRHDRFTLPQPAGAAVVEVSFGKRSKDGHARTEELAGGFESRRPPEPEPELFPPLKF